MARLINSFEQFFDAAGDPLVSGKLYFYESGSSSALKDTYADSAETIANSNPVIIGGDGRCPNVFGTGSYRVILTSADDVTLVTRDPVGGDSDIAFGADWNSPQIYSIDDVVYENGDYWISQTNNNQANQPSLDDGTNWIGISLVNPGSVVSTRGDVIVGNATGAESRLPRGTEGQSLTVNNSGDIVWIGRPNPNSVINGDFGCWNFGTSVVTSAGVLTWVCDQFYVLSAGAAVTVARASNNVSGSFSRYRAEITGAASVTTVKFATRLLAQDVAELVAYSAGYITISFKFTNNVGISFQPRLKFYTPATENDWTTPTERDSVILGNVADGAQADYSYSLDAAALTNIENGLEISIEIPSGYLDSATKNVSVAELKAERGQVVTDFTSLGGSYTANAEACLGFYESCSPAFGFIATAGSQAASITIPFNKRKWTSSIAVTNSLSITNGTLTALTANDFGWFMTLTSSGAGQVQISSGSIVADARLT